MGRSMFGYGKLTVTAARHGLDIVELDMVAAFLQLRYWHTPEEHRGSMVCTRTLLEQENITAYLTQEAGNASLGLFAKKALKAYTNCSGDVDGLDQLPPSLQALLRGIKREMQEVIRRNVAPHAELREHFAHRRHPTLSAHAPIDEHWEGQAINLVMPTVAVDDDDQFKNFIGRSHDGIDIPRLGRSDDDLVSKAREATGFRFSVKPYPNPFDIAKEKWPTEDWDQMTAVPVDTYVDDIRTLWSVLRAGANNSRVNAVSLVFRRLVHVALAGYLQKNGADIEAWSNCMWQPVGDFNNLTESIIQELVAKPMPARSPNEKYHLNKNVYPADDGDFVKKVAKLLVEFLPSVNVPTLDSQSADLLLFRNGMVVDFGKDEVYKNKMELRLSKHCDVDFEEWEACETDKADVRKLAAMVSDFFTLYPEGSIQDDDEAENIRTLVQALVPSCPALKHVWSTFEDHDNVIYCYRIENRVLSGHTGFAEAYVITGPVDCGKSKLVLRTQQILGTKPTNLCASLTQNFLTSNIERDPNAPAPTSLKLKGCRLATVKEGPGQGINPHTLKYTLDQTDVGMDARSNNSRSSEDTTFNVQWTWFWSQNGDFKIHDRYVHDPSAGVSDKVVELRPPLHFTQKPEAELLSNERQVDPMYKEGRIYKDPQWIAEIIFWARAFHVLNDLNKNRVIHPMPPQSVKYRQNSNVDLHPAMIRGWMEKNTVYCEARDADAVDTIVSAMKEELYWLDSSLLQAAGFGKTEQKRRRHGAGGRGGSDDIFTTKLNPDDPDRRPLKLKPKATPKPSASPSIFG